MTDGDEPPSLVPLVNGHADLERNTALVAGQTVRLTPNESRLLGYLAARAGTTIGQDELLQEVFGYAPSVRSRTVISTMQRLRKKVEADPASPVQLLSVYGRGYRFEPVGDASHVIGRSAELTQIREALDQGRLWVVAPGGFGKTTLVRRFCDVSGADVLWADLTDAQGEDGLHAAMARALGVTTFPDPAALRLALQHRAPSLIVLDAVEHLADPLPRLLEPWGDVAPILLTSRVPRAGEATLELGPLTPDDAARLFARATPRPVSPERLAPLLEGLAGVPLALELAGALLGEFDPEQLSDHRDDLSRLLTGGQGRQTSMDAVLEWSWERTPPDLQDALAALSTARGGLSLHDAVALTRADVHTVHRLRTWGWIVPSQDRVHLLDPIRQHVARRAPASLAQRHRALFLKHVQARSDAIVGGQARPFLVREWANLRIAVLGGLASRDPGAAELVLALGPVLDEYLPHRELIRWLDEAIEQSAGPLLGDLLVARARHWLGISLDQLASDLERAAAVGVRRPGMLHLRRAKLLMEQGDLPASTEAYWKALEELRGPYASQAKAILAYSLFHQGDSDSAHRLLREALAWGRLHEAPRCVLLALGTLGSLYAAEDRFDDALRAYDAALQMSRTHHRRDTEMQLHQLLGNLHLYAGRTDDAVHHWLTSYELAGRLGARVTRASATVNLALVDIAARDLDRADDRLHHARVVFEETGRAPPRAFACLQLGRVAALRGRWLEAERWFGECGDDLPADNAWILGVERCIALSCQGRADEARAAWEAGAPGTDAGSRVGRALADGFWRASCRSGSNHDAEHDAVIQAALAQADALPPDSMIRDLAARLRALVTDP